MDHTSSQRQRLLLALIATAFLVPGYYLVGRTQTASTPPASTALPGADSTPNSTAPAYQSEVMGTIPVGYLSGDDKAYERQAPQIVIPKAAEVLSTRATFRRKLGGSRQCLVPSAPANATVVIVNTDTGRGVECRNSIDPKPFATRAFPDEAVLRVDDYLKIADLTDAPIPVEVTW